jgi:hypothetical protein
MKVIIREAAYAPHFAHQISHTNHATPSAITHSSAVFAVAIRGGDKRMFPGSMRAGRDLGCMRALF